MECKVVNFQAKLVESRKAGPETIVSFRSECGSRCILTRNPNRDDTPPWMLVIAGDSKQQCVSMLKQIGEIMDRGNGIVEVRV